MSLGSGRVYTEYKLSRQHLLTIERGIEMRLILKVAILLFCIYSGYLVSAQVYRYHAPHITAASPWINKVTVYNNGDQTEYFKIILWKQGGETALEKQYAVNADSKLTLVMSNFAEYTANPSEIELEPVEGMLIIETASTRIRPKISFVFGDQPSVSEFFLERTLAREYLVPNPIYPHFSWTGVAYSGF